MASISFTEALAKGVLLTNAIAKFICRIVTHFPFPFNTSPLSHSHPPILTLALTLVLTLPSHAGCLNTPVNLHCAPCKVENALMQLEAQVDCSFSYNASQIPLNELVSGDFRNQPLNTVLEAVTGKKLEYVSRGRHLIFIEKTTEHTPKYEKKEYIIEGHVIDGRNGQVLSRATVYAVGNKYSALTNEQGYYRLEVNTDAEMLGVSYSKQSYLDTLIVVEPAPGGVKKVDVPLTPREAPIEKMPLKKVSMPLERREVEQLAMVRILVPEKQTQRAINLEFLEQIPVQFSLLPSIGTNKLTSGISNNTISINLLGGYNAGLNGFEAGGGVNIVRMDVLGMQSGGIGNIVGGEVQGIQLAGVFNNVRGSVKGLQAAGIHNIVLDTIQGVQAAGVFNILRGSVSGSQLAGVFNLATQNMSGLQGAGVFNITLKDVRFGQAAGVFNIAQKVSGLQAAGVLNIASKNVSGLQASGAFNIASKDVSGGQISGVLNVTGKDVTGAQITGFSNIAKDVFGTQIAGVLNVGKKVNAQLSGFLNVANKVDGVQIGVINIADSSGMAIGFLSISLKGYNHLDIAADELHYVNISYRTGNRKFYNILQFGVGSYLGANLFSQGYGFGTEVRIKSKKDRFACNLDLIARQIADFDNPQKPFNLDCMFNPQITWRLGEKRPFLVFGPSVHFFMHQGQIVRNTPDIGGEFELAQGFPPIFEDAGNEMKFQMWPGLKVGLRI